MKFPLGVSGTKCSGEYDFWSATNVISTSLSPSGRPNCKGFSQGVPAISSSEEWDRLTWKHNASGWHRGIQTQCKHESPNSRWYNLMITVTVDYIMMHEYQWIHLKKHIFLNWDYY